MASSFRGSMPDWIHCFSIYDKANHQGTKYMAEQSSLPHGIQEAERKEMRIQYPLQGHAPQ